MHHHGYIQSDRLSYPRSPTLSTVGQLVPFPSASRLITISISDAISRRLRRPVTDCYVHVSQQDHPCRLACVDDHVTR
jgi:hypothetical protein